MSSTNGAGPMPAHPPTASRLIGRKQGDALTTGKRHSRRWAFQHGQTLRPTLENAVMFGLWEYGAPLCPWELHQFLGLTCDRHSVNPVTTNLNKNGHLIGTGTYGRGSGGRKSERMWLAPQHLPVPNPDRYRGGGMSRTRPRPGGEPAVHAGNPAICPTCQKALA